MTAAAQVAASTTSSANVTGAFSHACALPASISAGELLLVVVGVWGPAGSAVDFTPGTPSGWTSVFDSNADDGSFLTGTRAFYKVASGSEGATVTTTWASIAATTVVALSMRITGAHGTAPIDTYTMAPFAPSVPGSVTVNAAKLDSLLVRGILYASPQSDPTTTANHTAINGTSGGPYNARNYAIQRTWTTAGATGATLYGSSSAGGISYTIAIAPSVSSQAIVMTGLSQLVVPGTHDVSGATTIAMSGLSQLAVPGTHGVTATGTVQTITATGLSQLAVPGTHAVVGAAAQTVVMSGLSQLALPGSQTVVPVVPFLGRSQILPWGASRRWNAWVELLVNDTLVASSARGDFALASGTVTEDISRAVRRDASVTLLFPTGQTVTAGAVYQPVGDGPFEINLDGVGSTDVIGGVPPAGEWDDSDADWDSVTVDWDTTGGSTGVALVTPATRATTTRSPFIPTAIGDLLDPNGPTVMRIFAGFYGEEVLMGYFDLSSVPVEVSEGGAKMTVTGQSFERRIAKAGFWQVEAVTAGSYVSTVAASLVTGAVAGAEVNASGTATVTGDLSYKPGDDRLTKLVELLAAAGLEGGFDRDNEFVIASAPVIDQFGTGLVRWEVADGHNANIATLNRATRDFSDENSYNGVIIEGDSHDDAASVPITYTLWNTNPGSPLYFDPLNPAASPTGPRPKYIRSELVRSNGDAAAMAVAELAKALMVTDSIDAEVPAHALIEMGHYARVACEPLGLDGVYRVTRVTHDLTGQPAQLSLYRFQEV